MNQIKVKANKQTDKYKSVLFCRLVYVAGMVMLVGIWCFPVFSIQVHAASEIEILRTAISNLQDEVEELQMELKTHVQNDVGITKIERTATEGNVDTYTITMTNGTTYDFIVTNGRDGKDGVDGKDGADGKDGTDSPMVVISMLIASISLAGNMIMAVLMVKNKKI